MARNFDRGWRPGRRWLANDRLNNLRRRLYRSHDGKLLGVFKGIAETAGWRCGLTRVVGVIVLLTLAGAMGAHGLHVSILVAGFFYLLLALLMQPPRPAGAVVDPTDPVRGSVPPPMPPPRYPGINRPRVDLAQLDRQLDGLNRRIQRMETIVTDREYDWNRRMQS